MSLPRPTGAQPVPPRRVIIIGGGASGVLLAAQLLRMADGPEVTIIERRRMLGCGVAYSTTDPSHLLNTRVANMTAYPDQPNHFLDWLHANGEVAAQRFTFVTRATYGRYLASLLDPWKDGPRLSCALSDCLRVEQAAGGIVAHLADGRQIAGDIAVLATGHALPDPVPDSPLSQPWSPLPPEQAAGEVMIVGSGLTMVDQVLTLLNAGHKGRIVALSRRGLLPQAHMENSALGIDPADLPLGQGIAAVMRWLRARVARHQAAGGDWRDVVDGLRPHLQALWREMPMAARRSFLTHAVTWWEVHRHRMPPCSAARIAAAIGAGQLVLLRGAFQGAFRDTQGHLHARFRARGAQGVTERAVVRIIDCRGIRRDPESHATPLVADLLAQGLARIDPLRISLDIGHGAEVLTREGHPSTRLFAIGPASRAAFWEITAIPDIREQAARLAQRLASPQTAVL